MAKKENGSGKKTPAGKRAATKKIATKKPQVNKVAAKKAAAKKAAPARAAARIANVAAADVAPSLEVFTGTLSLDDTALTARLDGVLMSMDTTSCSRQGLIDAHAAFRGKDGQRASVQGFEWDCGEAVIHVVSIL
jgi:hypothetical protein